MPALHNGNGEVSITLTDTPSLFNIDLGNQTEFDVLSIFVHTKPPEESYEANFDTAQIVNAYIIETDYCIQLYDLTHIGFLSMFPLESCGMRFFNLSEAAEITLDGFNFVVFYQQLTVSGSLTLRNLEPYTDKASTAQFWKSNEMTVGDNVDVSSSSYSDLDFSLLTTVGGNISFVNNTNCTFNFDKLTEATNLYFLDNINTTLPMFPVLTRARDIHLRGIIDTTSGPNIFPSLTLASGTVTIESWNDFNCSKLVAQERDRVINKLVCYGTDNGTDPNGLAEGSICAWLVLYFRRLLKRLPEPGELREGSKGKSHDTAQKKRHSLDMLQQLEGRSVVREKPDDHVQELYVQPAEKPDDQIHEMPSGLVGSCSGTCVKNNVADQEATETGTS
ncbi:hypothetical protein MGN70_014602 [Eutypa lata]|nr:hypothetical protein MGN70_014602 [Eutypa lata]